MEIKLNGTALLGIALLSTGLVLADFVSVIDTKSTGGITVTGGITQEELDATISEIKADYEAKIAAISSSEMVELWSGSVTDYNTITLNESVSNYDVIQFHGTAVTPTNNITHHFTKEYNSSDLIVGDRYNLFQSEYASSTVFLNMWFDCVSSTTIKAHVVSEKIWTNPKITKVYGIKY